jgi:hypothetical protein
MTYDYTKVPANLINDYLWDLANGTVTGSTKVPNEIFGTDVATYTYQPFFPVSENTGTGSEKAFVTYQSLPRLRGDSDYWLVKERMIYRVIAPMPTVLYLSNFINFNLNKFDETASRVNSHIKDSAVVFDKITAYSVNLPEESTKFNSVETRYEAEIIVDFDYRRTDS